jgi:apolipoprotein N-acyltransferase
MDQITLMTETLGWIGNIGFIWGCMEMARKHPVRSMIWNLVGNGFYIGMAILLGTPSLFCISLLLFIINCVGIYRWSGQPKS